MHTRKLNAYQENAMSYQCQNVKCMCVVQKANTTCFKDGKGTYFICSFCKLKTYVSYCAPSAPYTQSMFDRRSM